MLKVVQIIPDDRDMFGFYDRPAPFFGPAPAALLEGFALFPEEVEIHVISCIRRPMPAPEKLAENIFYHQIPVSGGYRRTLFIQAVRRIRKKLKEIDPDIVHGQGTEDYPGISAAFSGYPNCITLHGNMRAVARRLKYQPFPHMALTALAEIAALRKTDAVICNSSYTERCVGWLNNRRVRIPNAVRSSFFDLCPGSESNNSQPTFHNSHLVSGETRTLLCIGDILPYKNQLALIHALDGMPGIEDIKLLFVGSCYPGERYSDRVLQEISRRRWCEHVGRLDIYALQKKLGQCAGVIHPTLEDSFGLAVAEAQASGVPVAASDIGGLPDLIEHGRTGLLFNPRDSGDIQSKVMQLLEASVAESCAQNARRFAEEQYRPQRIARDHLRFYREDTDIK